jgi:endonuclease IV
LALTRSRSSTSRRAQWRPTDYGDEDFARFRDALAASEIGAVLIHAVYLLNCASDDPEIARSHSPR